MRYQVNWYKLTRVSWRLTWLRYTYNLVMPRLVSNIWHLTLTIIRVMMMLWPGDAQAGLKHEKKLCSGWVATNRGTIGGFEPHVVLKDKTWSVMSVGNTGDDFRLMSFSWKKKVKSNPWLLLSSRNLISCTCDWHESHLIGEVWPSNPCIVGELRNTNPHSCYVVAQNITNTVALTSKIKFS